MKAFEDSKKRTWVIDITVSAIRRIRELTQIDFGNPNTIADGTTIQRLSSDVVLLTDVLYAAMLPAINQKGIEKDDFCDSIAGDTIPAAIFALLEAVADFFPSAQGNLLRKILQAAKEAQEEAAIQAAESLEQILKTPADSLKNSQASSDATPLT